MRKYSFSLQSDGTWQVSVNGRLVAVLTINRSLFVTMKDTEMMPLSVLRGIYEGGELLKDMPAGEVTLPSGGQANFHWI